jgi:hypothetical protein
MTPQKFRAVSALMSFAAALLFLPIPGAAQTQNATDPSAFAITPQVFRFAKPFDDRSSRMTTDAAGNFYIAAGLDDNRDLNGFAVIKYSAQGKLLGTFHFRSKSLSAGFANDVKVDANGNIYAGGYTLFGALVMSFDASGKTRWTHLLGSAFTIDQINALALDQFGNVYAGGMQGGSMMVAKFTADGKLLWQRLHQGVAAGSGVTDVQLDSKGNLIVFGDTTNAAPGLDTTVLKINPQGKLLWSRNFSQSPDFNKVPRAGAVDHNDGIYATGDALNLITGDSFPYTVKYDMNGKVIFALAGAGNGGVSVAIDPAGKILLSGFTLLHGNPVSTASKFDPSGKKIWVTQIPSSGEIVSDAKGNVFVSGGAYTVTKLNPAGTVLWTFQASSQFSEFSTTGSVVDPTGNLIVTGTGFDFSAGQNDIVTLKFPHNSKPNGAQ